MVSIILFCNLQNKTNTSMSEYLTSALQNCQGNGRQGTNEEL